MQSKHASPKSTEMQARPELFGLDDGLQTPIVAIAANLADSPGGGLLLEAN